MSKETLTKAEETLRSHSGAEGVRLVTDVVQARIEVLRDTLEREESETTRGRLKECRDFMKLLTE